MLCFRDPFSVLSVLLDRAAAAKPAEKTCDLFDLGYGGLTQSTFVAYLQGVFPTSAPQRTGQDWRARLRVVNRPAE